MPSDEVTFYHYDGYGVEAKNVHYYSQVARVGDRIETSGQGRWDPKTGKCRTTIEEEIKQAFENVELTLKTAGGKGWEQVVKIVTYHVDLQPLHMELVIKNLKEKMRKRQPLWTLIGVAKLAFPDMHIEIDVVAYDPK
ncbi:hypothetical protein Rhopal_006773-T1 [Rhodotorula paludigena]|uniref:Uncharacterized protein n=1 Tax=Rhodotorula paludigena TaxID=86838 RepID=A0AAV5GW45_9BASI|nr:hypothetical protein Rhopal_006773-T1 [Rhodotorula paludigena]